MEISKTELKLLARAVQNPDHFKELIVTNFPKFDWKLTEIDSNRCEVIDEFMSLWAGKKVSSRSIVLEGVEFFRKRINELTKEILADTTRFLCAKVEESLKSGLPEFSEKVTEIRGETLKGKSRSTSAI